MFVYVCVCSVALSSVTDLQLFDMTQSTMTARWDRVDGVSGYMLLYSPLTEDGDLARMEVAQERKKKKQGIGKKFDPKLLKADFTNTHTKNIIFSPSCP